jgi:hypothetical protein
MCTIDVSTSCALGLSSAAVNVKVYIAETLKEAQLTAIRVENLDKARITD